MGDMSNSEERRLARAARDGWDKPVPPEHEFCRVDVLAVTDALARTLDRLEAAERERDKEKAEWRESIARAWKRTDAAESALAEAREAWKELRPFVRRRPDRLDAALAARPGEQKPPCMGARDERCHPEPGMCACFDRPVT
jgi:hypothetical protein